MGKEQSHVLPNSSQQLPYPCLLAVNPHSHGKGFQRPLVFSQHCTILCRKQVTPCSQVSKWKWNSEFSVDFFGLWGSFGCVSWFCFSQTCLLLISLKDKWSIYLHVCLHFKCTCFEKNGHYVILQLTSNSDIILSPFHPLFPLFILLYWF